MIFTIDHENDIRAHETEAQGEEAATAGGRTIVVRSEKELNKAAAEWPASRLVEVWNSFAGRREGDQGIRRKDAAHGLAITPDGKTLWVTSKYYGYGFPMLSTRVEMVSARIHGQRM